MTLAGVACIGYCRVSTERQAGETQTSLGDQQVAITALALKLGVVVGAWYRDEGVSGATVDQRPALRSLIADCKADPRKHLSGLVLVLNDSRWGRFPNAEEATYWRHELERAGWMVRFAEGDDMGDGIGRQVMRIVGSAQASEVRKAIKANAKRGSRGTAEQGYWGTAAPYGYRRKVVYPAGRERVLASGQRKATDEKVALTPDLEESVVVSSVFARYVTGTESLASMTQWLLDTVPSRKWSRQAVRSMLLNPAYVGDVVSGRVPNDEGLQPESAWVTHRDAHPAIVERGTFAMAHEVLSRNKQWTNRVRTAWILSGLVRCRCGAPFVAGGGTKATPSYRCGSKVKVAAERCSYPGSIGRRLLERAVVSELASVIGSAKYRKRILAHLDAALAETIPRDEVEAIGEQIRDASHRRDRMVAAVADGTLTGDEARERLTAVRRLLARLESQQDALSRDTTRNALVSVRDVLAMMTLDFRATVLEAEGPDLRETISPWIHSAEFDTASRELTLRIRILPHINGDLIRMGWHDGQTPERVTIRRVVVGARR